MQEIQITTTNNVNDKSEKMSVGAKFLLGLTGGAALGLSVICGFFVAPAFRKICLPYVPATTEQLKHVLSFLPKNNNLHQKVLDIGSGDGRIVIAAAQQGYKANGVELNPWLILYSRFTALRQGVSKQTKFFHKDLWKFNISPYHYIIIFGVDEMMINLEQKLIKEAATNAKIIACRFPLPNLQPSRKIEDGINSVWFYDISKKS